MATYIRRERTEKIVQFVVPAPSTAAELDKAISAAYRECEGEGAARRSIGENEIMVRPGDDEIIVEYRVVS